MEAGPRLRTYVAGKGPGGTAGAGLRLSANGGGSGRWRFRPGTPADSPGPKWVGEILAEFPSNSPIP